MSMKFLESVTIKPAALTSDPQMPEYLDGLAIPKGYPTLWGVPGGSGKTTALLTSAVTACANGEFQLFGKRQHDRPLRAVLVLGEEATGAISAKISTDVKGGMDTLGKSLEGDRLRIVSWEEAMDGSEKPEKVFGEAGELTDSGRSLLAGIADHEPDLVVFDTLKSLSSGDYNSDNVSYATFGALRRLARRTGAAVIMTSHVTKAGADKITPDSAPGDMLALIKGSGSLVDATRHAVMTMQARPGSYKNLETEEDDLTMMCAVKTNVPGCTLGRSIFPVVRSNSLKTMVATDGTGRPLSDVEDANKKDALTELMDRLPAYVKAAARLRKPFASKPRNANSPESLIHGQLSVLFESSPRGPIVSEALEELEERGLIVRCTTSRAGAGEVWDVPEGDYANQDAHERETRTLTGDEKYKLQFSAGAVTAEDLEDEVQKITLSGWKPDAGARFETAARDNLDQEPEDTERVESGQVEEEGEGEGGGVDAGGAWAGDCPF